MLTKYENLAREIHQELPAYSGTWLGIVCN